MSLVRMFPIAVWVLLPLFDAASMSEASVAIPIEAWEPGSRCALQKAPSSELLQFASHNNEYTLIAPPPEGTRERWLEDLRQYRQAVRTGRAADSWVLAFDFDGVRSWARMPSDAAKALRLTEGEELFLEIVARWKMGACDLCFAYDLHDDASDAKTGWTGVLSTVAVPKDGEWHRLSLRLPSATGRQPSNNVWRRPIIGFDATRDSQPAQIEVRSIEVSTTAAGSEKEQMAAAASKLSLPVRTKPLSFDAYARDDLRWLASSYACRFVFMYDHSFYDHRNGRYLVEEYLDRGDRDFGGYDSVLLWHAYPRIGLDDRNQFDFYRDMPGGLSALRDVVDRFHCRGVKVFINYNPWDRATRREGVPDEQALAQMVGELGVDGIFLDTMFASSPGLREAIDRERPGVVLVPEIHPAASDLGQLTGSWAQFPPNPFRPALLHHKWIEPRHMEYQIRRWNTLQPGTSHEEEIENAFFNGSGMMIWENIFGAPNPWNDADKADWRRAVRILRTFSQWFQGDRLDPFIATHSDGLYANRWPSDGGELFTLIYRGQPLDDADLVSAAWRDGLSAYDLWNGRAMPIRREGNRAVVSGSVNQLGCILITSAPASESLNELLEQQSATPVPGSERLGSPQAPMGLEVPRPITKTAAQPRQSTPPGMVYVGRTAYSPRITHVRRECGCYPDPGTPHREWLRFQQGWHFSEEMQHDFGPIEVQSFFIDETEVTNRQFKRFLDTTDYKPTDPTNFLKHWRGGEVPRDQLDLPVVYVDLLDARAYAAWAGKRLPTEAEWQLASGGPEGRPWPWGEAFDQSRVNLSGGPMPAKSLPGGRSPYGCYHMAGNVYELTESERFDGMNRFVMLRGGSWYDPNAAESVSSIWYFDGGPRSCQHHAKMILMGSSLDRAATVGFRCVMDAAE